MTDRQATFLGLAIISAGVASTGSALTLVCIGLCAVYANVRLDV